MPVFFDSQQLPHPQPITSSSIFATLRDQPPKNLRLRFTHRETSEIGLWTDQIWT